MLFWAKPTLKTPLIDASRTLVEERVFECSGGAVGVGAGAGVGVGVGVGVGAGVGVGVGAGVGAGAILPLDEW